MQHLFLSSAIGTPSVAISIRRRLGHSNLLKTAFITTPIEVEDMTDDSWYQDDRRALKDNGFDIFDYTITGKTPTDINNDLSNFDAIYISGGNTRHLLLQSQKSGFDKFIKNFVESGKLYLGTSAGSIIAGPKLPPYLWGEEVAAPNVADFNSYNLVNFTLVPHWGSDFFKDLYLGGRMEQIFSESQQPYILCNDHEYIEVLGDTWQIIDARKEI